MRVRAVMRGVNLPKAIRDLKWVDGGSRFIGLILQKKSEEG
jgi:hypothetical protein